MISLTDEQEMLVRTLSDLAEAEFREGAFEWDHGEAPWDNLQLLAHRGFMGMNFPAEYGGAGMTEMDVLLAMEAIGRVCPVTMQHFGDLHLISPRAILQFGTEAAKEKYLPKVAAGEHRIAIGISEAQAGSDLKAMETTAEDDGDAVVVEGEKMWMSNGSSSQSAMLWVKFPEGMGSLIVDLDADGVEFVNHFTNMAGDHQSQVLFDQVRVPKENVLTRGPEGFHEQLKTLNWERLEGAAYTNTMALCALDKALEYAEDREQFGQPIGEFQGIEWKLADIATKLEASRALTYGAASKAIESDGVPDPLETMMAKLYAAVIGEEVVSEALQIHGANGYQRGHPLEFLYRMIRGMRIAGGTDGIQRNQIAKRLKEDGFPRLA